MTEITPYFDNHKSNHMRLRESLSKIQQANTHLKNKLNNKLYSSLSEKYKITTGEVADILTYCAEQTELLSAHLEKIYTERDESEEMIIDTSSALFKKSNTHGEALMLAKNINKLAEALSYADDILESVKSHYIEKRKETALRRKGINPTLYDIESSYRYLSNLEDTLDVISISVCDALDGNPDNGVFMDLLMQATDLSSRLSEARHQISKVMEKMISKSGTLRSDFSAHELKMIFDLKRERRALEQAISLYSRQVAKELNAKVA